jgi:uncharacterized membrane protein
LGVLFPPLLTILIFVWVINTTKVFFLEPVTSGVREALVWWLADIRDDLEPEDPAQRTVVEGQRVYYRLDNDTFIPQSVYDRVKKNLAGQPVPQSAEAIYRQYVDGKYLRAYFTVPCFVSVFILLLYLLGRFMAAGMGRFFGNFFEQGVRRLPLVRSVYAGVKQVSDFLFTGHEIRFTRIVAVEFPRKGVWSLGFVTSEGLLDIRTAADEAVVTVLIPYSPLPITGCTVTVLKSECIDLNMTIDQALQFIISCGVVIPPQQFWQLQPASSALPQAGETVLGEMTKSE